MDGPGKGLNNISDGLEQNTKEQGLNFCYEGKNPRTRHATFEATEIQKYRKEKTPRRIGGKIDESKGSRRARS